MILQRAKKLWMHQRNAHFTSLVTHRPCIGLASRDGQNRLSMGNDGRNDNRAPGAIWHQGGCYRDNQRRKLTQKEEADDDSGRMLGFNARYVYWLTPGQVFVLISGAIGCPGIRRNWTSRCAVDRMWIRPLNTYRDETTTEVGWQWWRIQNQKMLHTLETPVA
jgi:hypothetical protein